MEGKAHDLDLLKDRCERIALIDKMSIADQSGLRAVLPEARHRRQLQEGALVLFLCCRPLRCGVQRQRRPRRGRDRQGERRRLLGRRHGHQLSGADVTGAAVHGLRLWPDEVTSAPPSKIFLPQHLQGGAGGLAAGLG